MNKPDYNGGSIVNLVSSISKAIGSSSKYKSLKLLNPSEISGSKNIVLMIIDGLGFDFLMKHGKNSIFNQNLRGKITSTFPSSTSAAMTAFYTGLAPQEHGMTGWEMYSKEFSATILPLPYYPKLKWGYKLGNLRDIKTLFNLPSVIEKSKIRSHLVIGDHIINSDFSKVMSKKRKGFSTLNGFLLQIRKAININNKKKFIFSYYSVHDSMAHKYGPDNKRVLKHFKELDQKLTRFINSLEGTNTTIVITADHGQIRVDKSNIINLKNHQKLRDCLTMPLTGEHRFAYCYVKPEKEKEFLRYIKIKLKKYCEVYKSSDLLKKGYFGLFKAHENFKDRIGDYTLIMKKNYAIYDQRPKNKPDHVGDHGGLSDEELYVPLIVIKK
jgi:predicted AlkP superfamily pyrophosphatase or phosphodiesterase